MRKLVLFFMLWAGFSMQVLAGEVVEPVILQEGEGLKAKFSQSRVLTGFDGAIDSSGVLYLLEDDYLVWDVVAPFPSRMIIEKDRVTQIVDEVETLNIPTSKFPMLKNMQEVISASLKGDWDILTEKFGKEPYVESMGWSLVLSKEELPAGFPFTSFDIQGGEFVDVVTMIRANGDRDEIHLFDHEILSEEILTQQIEQD